jgi:hypothetical protein
LHCVPVTSLRRISPRLHYNRFRTETRTHARTHTHTHTHTVTGVYEASFDEGRTTSRTNCSWK